MAFRVSATDVGLRAESPCRKATGDGAAAITAA
jgi:hypothetical protein